ncbi:hypothetical protein BHYA_0349g00060 [Botrytis hyacinthi]|uniref:Heterokaryon incompatibility domain-containing protein n=1 Tax=Botrytis hyacinthi TaxID=278943 RepID=A0A4Z1GAN8_9HELO|nr:hypothetical protein BHYA_0349g00060 [Botrytis hyacinthi]
MLSDSLRRKTNPHHSSLQSIIDASASGCWVCHRLLAYISRKIDVDDAPGGISSLIKSSTWHLCRQPYQKSWRLTFRFGDDNDYFHSFTVISRDEYGGPDTNHASIAGDSTMSDAALAQASKWYRECLLKHTTCNTSLVSKRLMPTRLLRIDEGEKYVRLVVTKEDIVQDSHFSTLSHCWGNSNVLKLTISNLESFKAGISLERLPKTFIEAIFVARKLSIPYIWIDSLCIIQDSDDDWQTESVSMEDVYGNSILNVMATASKNSHEGLSRPRDPRMLEICPAIQSRWEDAENDLFYLFNEEIWSERLYSGPLLKRGWVLQECVLSPRSLHFCDGELLWECREMASCETYPAGLPEACEQENFKIRPLSSSDLYERMYLIDGAQKTMEGIAYDRWVRWITLYSKTYLTRDSDKLAAVSALAKCTRAVFDDVYVAGLWRSIFAEQLVWRGLSTSRPKHYRAPTWSWTSVDGPFLTSSIRPNTKYHIEIDEVRVTPVSSVDDTGSISDGYFRAWGLLICDTLVNDQRYGKYPLLAGKDKHTNIITYLDAPGDLCRDRVIVLPILTNSDGPDHEDNWFHALLVQERAMSPNGFYTRIGYAYVVNDYVEYKLGLDHPQSLSKLKFPGNHGGSNSQSNKSTQDGGGADFDVELDESVYLEGSLGSFVVY